MRSRSLHTEIQIAASPEAVWQVLTDFAAFPQWNPLILEARGKPEEGRRITITLRAGEGRPFRVRPRLVRVIPHRELRWLGRVGLPGVFDGEHVFRIEPGADGTGVRFIHMEHFRGMLVHLLWRKLDSETRAGFEAMNQALKARVEGGDSAPSPCCPGFGSDLSADA
jgi:hypothetical protein